MEAWRRIQLSRSFSLRIQERDGQRVAIGVFARRLDPEVRRDISFISRTLNLKPKNGEVLLDFGAIQRRPDELAALSRSMIEIMNEFSADIDVPAEHVAKGRTYATAQPTGRGSPLDKPQVNIHSGPNPPGGAFAAVNYRNTWYWISDGDISTKRSITFLLLFFSLAETGVTPEAPVLTIPVQ